MQLSYEQRQLLRQLRSVHQTARYRADRARAHARAPVDGYVSCRYCDWQHPIGDPTNTLIALTCHLEEAHEARTD